MDIPLFRRPTWSAWRQPARPIDAAYCNSPLCMPSRMSFMTGRLASYKIGAWDNWTPMRSDQVTWAHRLRAVGYDVALSGKQHFGGADQYHGFQEQLARDLHAERYHADSHLG